MYWSQEILLNGFILEAQIAQHSKESGQNGDEQSGSPDTNIGIVDHVDAASGQSEDEQAGSSDKNEVGESISYEAPTTVASVEPSENVASIVSSADESVKYEAPTTVKPANPFGDAGTRLGYFVNSVVVHSSNEGGEHQHNNNNNNSDDNSDAISGSSSINADSSNNNDSSINEDSNSNNNDDSSFSSEISSENDILPEYVGKPNRQKYETEVKANAEQQGPML